MQLKLIQDYKEIPSYRHSFNALAGKIFGIDFEHWDQLGFWNDRYVCYSLMDGERVVSNVSTSRLELLWKGERYQAVQIGTVMTDLEYRNRGLAAQLMNLVLPEAQPYIDEDSTFFLKSTKLRLDGEYLYPYTARA